MVFKKFRNFSKKCVVVSCAHESESGLVESIFKLRTKCQISSHFEDKPLKDKAQQDTMFVVNPLAAINDIIGENAENPA